MEKIHKESVRHRDMDKSVDKDIALTIGIFSDRFALGSSGWGLRGQSVEGPRAQIIRKTMISQEIIHVGQQGTAILTK